MNNGVSFTCLFLLYILPHFDTWQVSVCPSNSHIFVFFTCIYLPCTLLMNLRSTNSVCYFIYVNVFLLEEDQHRCKKSYFWIKNILMNLFITFDRIISKPLYIFIIWNDIRTFLAIFLLLKLHKEIHMKLSVFFNSSKMYPKNE